MRSSLFLTLAFGISALALTSGCAKKVAVAPRPAPPVQTASPEPRPEPAPERTTRQAAVSATPTAPAVSNEVATKNPKPFEDFLNQLLDAYFDYNAAHLRTDAQAALNKNSEALTTLLKEFPGTKFVVEGDCDERGSAEYNLALGEQRAKAAKDFLIQIGVPADRLSTISYGKERPVCTDHTEDCWQKNRRAHLTASR